MADPILAGVGDEVREAADVLVVARLQSITPDHLHGALLTLIRQEPKEEPRRMIIAVASALVERASDRQLDVPAPGEHWISGEVDVYGAKQASTRCPGSRSACSARRPSPQKTSSSATGVQNFGAASPREADRVGSFG
jgi:hypothetical protein